MTTYLCLHPASLTTSTHTVYCQTATGVIGCRYNAILNDTEELRPAIRQLAARMPALAVLKGCRTQKTREAWLLMLRTAWEEVSAYEQRPVSVGVRAICSSGVFDITKTCKRKVDCTEPLPVLSSSDFQASLTHLSQYISSETDPGHIVVHFERSCKPAFLTAAGTGLAVVWLACPESAPSRDIQLFECHLFRLSLAELARGVSHVPYSFEPLISQVKGTIAGDKLIITCFAEASYTQSIWLIETTGQMNSSLFSIRNESRRMQRMRLTSQLTAVERVLATSHGVRAEVRRLASVNADLNSLYRDLTTPIPRETPLPMVVNVKKEKVFLGAGRQESMDLVGCVLLPGTRKPKGNRLLLRNRRTLGA